MKKKWLIGLLIVVSIGTGIFLFSPRPLLSDGEVITTDITDQIDPETLTDILKDCTYGRLSRKYSSHYAGDTYYEILGSGEAAHISLGKRSYVGAQGTQRGYPIHGGEALIARVDALLNR